ncbi:MAG: D-tyrosyl-tRNA(Tyr) deacylase [bacterium]|nr:D-tyrosyl-tRNA(Tyr) deacylase [bacterium]
MRCVVQRSGPARVEIEGRIAGEIEAGLVVLVAFAPGDTETELKWMVNKLLNLRIFSDDQGKMNRSLQDTNGGVLLVSQFTLYGNCRKGMRPSFMHSAPPEEALANYNLFSSLLKQQWPTVAEGEFGASMSVSLTNLGPVTLIIDRDAGKDVQ